MEHRQVVVIGAGVSGLSFARRCVDAQIETLVLERNARIGGCIETIAARPGLLLERGTHSMYRIYTECFGMLSSSLRNVHYPNLPFRRFVDSEGKRTSFWRHFHPTGLLCTPASLWARPSGKTLSTYFSTILGRKNFNDLFGPAFDALYCQPAEHYPAALLFKRRDRRSLAHLPKAFFFEGGMESIVIDLARGIDCRPDSGVSRIDYDGRRFWLTRQSDETPTISCDILAVATPPAEAARLVKTLKVFPSPPSISESVIASLSLIYRTAMRPPDEAGLIGRHNAVYSVVFAKRLPSADPGVDGATIHYSYADIDTKKAIEVACRLLRIELSDILSIWRKTNRLAALRPAHLSQIARLRERPCQNLALLGNYFDGFSIEDCVRRSSEEFERIHRAFTGDRPESF